MASSKFYHVYLVPLTKVSDEMVENKLNLALDWFKYDKSTYILYSSSDITKLTARFKPLVEPTGRLFICELNIGAKNGWMTKDFWEWIRKPRNKQLILKKKP
jgi:hypothetical protein